MISSELLDKLCCPETRQNVQWATPELIVGLNQQIAQKDLKNKAGNTVTEPLEHGLIRSDGKIVYPVRKGIPIMLITEGIPIPASR